MTKLMLVEDDNNLREIYEARLAAEGYEIVSAPDGEAALALAAKERPELIISDVMMPKISGFEMLDIIRNTEGIKNAKVIMLTALGQSEDSARAASLGADRYLVKSQVTLEDIVKATHELLNPEDAAPGVSLPDVPESSAAPAAAAVPAPAAPAPEPLTEPTMASFSPVAPPTAEPAVTPITVTAPPAEPPTAQPQATDTPTVAAPVTPLATPPATDTPTPAVSVVPAPADDTAADTSQDNTATDDEPDTSANTDLDAAAAAADTTPETPEATSPAEASTDDTGKDGIPVIPSPVAGTGPADAPAEHLFGEPKQDNQTADQAAAPAQQDEATDAEAAVPGNVTTDQSDTPVATPVVVNEATEAPSEQVAQAAPQAIAEEEATMQAQIDSFIKDQDVASDTDEPAAGADTPKPVYNIPVADMSADTAASPQAPPNPSTTVTPEVAVVPAQGLPVMEEPASPEVTTADAAPVPPPAAPDPTLVAPDLTPAAVDQNIAASLQQMTNDMAATPAPAPATGPETAFAMPPQDAQAVQPAAPVAQPYDESLVSGKKVISPISDGPKLDIHQLLEVEEAKIAAQQASAPGQPVVMPADTPSAAPQNSIFTGDRKPGEDPNSIAL